MFIKKYQILTVSCSRSVDELDSESYSAPWTPTASSADVPIDGSVDSSDQKRTYSREEFLHEAAATGGPNIGMRIRLVIKIILKEVNVTLTQLLNLFLFSSMLNLHICKT